MIAARWRTPTMILVCGGLILTIGLGVRHNFGLYLQPMTVDLGIGREVFSFAIAIQNLVYGLAQPFTGMIADRLGTAGVLIGIALGCSGFSIVFGVVGRAVPADKRTMALGIVGAAGSFGQFVMLPYGQ